MANTYEYIQQRNQQGPLNPAGEDDDDIGRGGDGGQAEDMWTGNDDEGEDGPSQSGADYHSDSQSQSQSQSQKDTFSITIRAGVREEKSKGGGTNIHVHSLNVRVRPSTKCGKIVETFFKRTGLSPRQREKARIEIVRRRFRIGTVAR